MRCRTRHLTWHEGRVHVREMPNAELFDSVDIGWIADDGSDNVRWPVESLGEAPRWFWPELSDLIHRVQVCCVLANYEATDYHRQVLADYRAGVGTIRG